MFALRTPCSNCPFRIEGAIELEPGRLEGIVEELVRDDWSTFHCHKTVYSNSGGDWGEDGQYEPSGKESMCAGAAAYLHKIGRPTVAMRLAFATNTLDVETLVKNGLLVIDPVERTK